MATKKATKKASVKKAATKRTYTRKTPAKATKKVAKRKYTRRAKPEVLADVAAAAPEQAMDSPSTDPVDRASDDITNIDVVDLREVPPVGRFALLAMLDSQGYLTYDVSNLMSPAVVNYVLFETDAISFRHQNKLVSFLDWSEVGPGAAVSRIGYKTQFSVSFSEPEQIAPENVVVNGHVYKLLA